MRFGVLGDLLLGDDAGGVIEVSAPKQRSLLGLLLIRRGTVTSADAIADALWSGSPPASADTAVRFHVSKLRKLIDPDGAHELIIKDPAGYRLQLDGHELDVDRFEALVAQGESVQQTHPDRAHGLFVEALNQWRGRAYQFVEGELFAAQEIARLTQMKERTLQARIESELRLGRSTPLIHELTELVAANPHDEHLALLLMRAMYAAGQAAGALRVAGDIRSRLGSLGLEPGPDITELEDRILLHDSVLPHTDGGAHSSRDLPVPLTRLIGRKSELAEVCELVRSQRLTTIVGAPGCGKTRLAIEAAASVADEFESGATMIELGEIRDPDLALRTLGAAFGVNEVWGEDYLSLVIDRLRSESILIVIDNAEHLADAVADFARQLLERCPKLHLLVTSRLMLGVPGEATIRLEPMHVPDRDLPLDEVTNFDSVKLFVERAAVASGGFELSDDNRDAVVSICEQIDGLPLAIELAAAGTAGLSVGELADRLQSRRSALPTLNRPASARQRTMEEAVRWSVDLLEPAERKVFMRLAAFSGGMTMAAAEQVAADGDIGPDDVFELVLRLVRSSLLVPERSSADHTRYRMLTVVRDLAGQMAREAGEWVGAASRHARYFADIAESIAPHLEGADEESWRARGDLELDNFRAALEWTLGDGDSAVALRLTPALTWFWYWRSHLREGQRWTARTLEQTVDEPDVARMRTFYAGGLFHDVIGNLHDGEDLFQHALALAQRDGNTEYEARVLTGLAFVARDRGDLAEALTRTERSLEIDGERPQMNRAISLRIRGLTLAMLGDVAAGIEDVAAAEMLYTKLGNRSGVAWAHAARAYIGGLAGEPDAAERAVAAVDRFASGGDVRGHGWALETAAVIAGDEGRLSDAIDLALRAQQRLTQVGDRRGLGYANLARGDALLRSGDIGGGEDALWSAGELLESLPDHIGLCRLACGRATLAALRNDEEDQANELRQAMRQAEAAGYPWGYVDILQSVGSAAVIGQLADPGTLRSAIANGDSATLLDRIRTELR